MRVISAAIVLALVGCGPRVDAPDPFKDRCTIVSKVDTGKRLYQPKAQYRIIYRYEYACPAQTVILESTEV